jgi:hypothetical protein
MDLKNSQFNATQGKQMSCNSDYIEVGMKIIHFYKIFIYFKQILLLID